MNTYKSSRYLLRLAMHAGIFAAISAPVLAQAQDEEELEEITVTGTRIKNLNVVAASQVTVIDEQEIDLKMTTNVDQVFRDLPTTIPGDGQNVNNGSAGQATLNLRALGEGRSLLMIDGHRLAPYDINGQATVTVIPVNMLERVDVITGGASAVYGSDAMAGAVNFILRKDFEGLEIDLGYSETDSGEAINDGGGNTTYMNFLFGANFSDDRGNITVGGGRTKRGSVLLGDRSFGLFGVSSRTGAGLGSQPEAPSADCTGNNPNSTAHSTGVGSTTAVPATLNLRSGNSYQFRDDLSLVRGECALFNFNPFNYYQTPQDRTQATTIVSYDISDNVEAYARATFMNNTTTQQVAPSGTFGQPWTIPVRNPFFNAAARTTIIDDLNAGAVSFVTETGDRITEIQALPTPTQDELDELTALQAALAADPLGFNRVGIQDVNGDGVFDTNDAFTSTARRRTVELGPRTAIYDTDYYQYVIGLRGRFGGNFDNWNFDLSYNKGESDFVEFRDGYTNLTNLQFGINTVDPDQCIDLNGTVTDFPCTPINIFGPLGSITDEQRQQGFFSAVAADNRLATQEIISGTIDGEIEQMSLPWADNGLSIAVGFDFGTIKAQSSPDECLKLPPSSCQGGAGGNRLPVNGEYSSDEYFIEAILPIVQGKRGFENLAIEAGYRDAKYDVQGGVDAWKAGISWEIIPSLRFRYMEQQTVRVANVGELFRPITTGLDNATFDPCSIGNPNPPAPGSALFNLCVQTGMLPSQVGTVPDIIAGQINVFNGTNPAALPSPEEGASTTFGFVWQPEFGFFESLLPTTISLDYYNIEIENYIDQPSGQEALDICYVLADPVCLAGVVRSGGAITESGTGIPAYYTNFKIRSAEGVDLSIDTGFDLGRYGEFGVQWTAHQYLSNEFQTTPTQPVIDCKGRYGTSCDPVPEYRQTMRFNWYKDNYNASLLWRHISDMDAQTNEAAALFPAFRYTDNFNYLDLTLGYSYKDMGRISLLITNLLDENPPILGDNTGSTVYNSGSTFPALFDTMGRIYSVNLKLTF